MIKKYIILSLSLLISPAWAGKMILKDGKEIEIPEEICIRHNAYELGDIFLEVDHEEIPERTKEEKQELYRRGIANPVAWIAGFYLEYHQGGMWPVNKRYDYKEPIQKLLIRVQQQKLPQDKTQEFFLSYPTYTCADENGYRQRTMQHQTFYYRLSDIMENKLDENGFTVQDK